MESVGAAVFWTVQALAVLLFLLGVGAFRVLVQGCFSLRRRARAGSPDYSDVLLKSALVPPVTTIAVPPDASAESRQFRGRPPPAPPHNRPVLQNPAVAPPPPPPAVPPATRAKPRQFARRLLDLHFG